MHFVRLLGGLDQVSDLALPSLQGICIISGGVLVGGLTGRMSSRRRAAGSQHMDHATFHDGQLSLQTFAFGAAADSQLPITLLTHLPVQPLRRGLPRLDEPAGQRATCIEPGRVRTLDVRGSQCGQ